MTFWDKVRSILKSEASDIGDELGKARDSFDATLTRKEEELAASPKERMDMILDDIGDSDSEFDRILDKAEGRTSMAAATEEVRETATGEPMSAVADAATSEPKPQTTTSEPDGVEPEEARDPAAEQAAAQEAAAIDRQRVLDARRAAADAKFEDQKAKADDILDELRGELGIDD